MPDRHLVRFFSSCLHFLPSHSPKTDVDVNELNQTKAFYGLKVCGGVYVLEADTRRCSLQFVASGKSRCMFLQCSLLKQYTI